jgi:hypothetical protein
MASIQRHAWSVSIAVGSVAAIIALAADRGGAAVVLLIGVPLFLRFVIWGAANNALPRTPRGPI